MKRKRIRLISLLLAVMMVAVCCVGCSSSSDTSGGSGSSAATGSTDDYYEFSLTMHDSETSVSGKYLQSWADQVYDATDGHVTVNIFFDHVLAEATDVYDTVLSGGADIGWLYTAYASGLFPLSEVITLPLQGFGDSVVSTEVLWDLYEEYDEVADEWSDFKLLMLYGNPGMLFASAGDPIESLDDLQGLQIRCPSGAITDVLQAWGASPIDMSTPLIYEALEKHNIDGYIFEESGIVTFSLQEQTTYITDNVMFDGPFGLVMNWDSWNSLPQEYQDIIDSLCGYDASIGAAQAFKDNAVNARETITDAGVEWVQFDDDALAELQVAADEYAESWAETITAVDGVAYLSEAKSLAEQYGG